MHARGGQGARMLLRHPSAAALVGRALLAAAPPGQQQLRGCGATAGVAAAATAASSACTSAVSAPHAGAGLWVPAQQHAPWQAAWAGPALPAAWAAAWGGGARHYGSSARRRARAAAAQDVSTTAEAPAGGVLEAGAAPEAQRQQQQEGQEEQQPGQEQQQQQQQDGGGAQAKRRAPRYSPLHHNIEEFCRRVVPTRDERAAKQRVIDVVATCTRKSLEGVALPEGAKFKVQPFGSFVSGLSTWNSDVDIVISGLATPSRLTGGFSQSDKRFVAKVLERIARELRRTRRLDVRSLVIIRTARIPIIKLQTGPASGSVVADISLGDESGPAAARYVTQQIAACPPLAPLTLVLKVYLRRCGLNEVANGGLSSFGLTLMVLAHLQEEIKAGNDVFDLGEALYGFLVRYGEEFDYASDAVSVASGGIVPKIALGAAGYESASGSFDDPGGNGGDGRGGGAWAPRERLMVDDPLTGRDVSAGTYRVDGLRLAFTRAARRLEALARNRRGADAASVNYLQGLFDVEPALVRGPRDLHGHAFPGGELPLRARRGGGRGGGRGAPREVYVEAEDGGLDLEALGGDEMLAPEGGPYGGGGGGDGDDAWGVDGDDSGSGGGRRRRRQRRS